MNKNPKMIAGIAGLAVMLILAVVLATYMIPTIGEVRREMSLTPTPLPPVPGSVRAAGYVEQDTPEPALGTGSRGDKVIQLQERLKALGYYDGEIDGQFGQGTLDAVIAFQMKNGLDADGYAGEKTQDILYSDEAVKNDNEE
jgi:peptidoglycan hydrolase-like protein with peptidoglycan-binding domain